MELAIMILSEINQAKKAYSHVFTHVESRSEMMMMMGWDMSIKGCLSGGISRKVKGERRGYSRVKMFKVYYIYIYIYIYTYIYHIY
jgi:hypothetical protein